MQPLLYPNNTIKQGFEQSNGLGFFNHCTECVVTEERNGLYELKMTILKTDRLSNQVAVGMFVKALANFFDEPQIFQIYQLTVTDKKIIIKAQHLKYVANGNLITEAYVYTGTPTEAWTDFEDLLAFENHFNFSSDIATSATVTAAQKRPIRLGDLLGGVDGSFLDTYGGEFYYNNFDISLLKNRGTDTGVCLRYGSNISSFSQDSDINTVYSHFLGYSSFSVVDTANKQQDYNMFVYTDLIDLNNDNIFYKRVLSFDFEEEFQSEQIIVNSSGVPQNWGDLKAKLTAKAQAYINSNYSSLTEISTTITIDVEDVLGRLNGCKLCDTVLIYFEPLNIEAKAKIVATEFDSINEKYTKIQLGTIKKTIVDLLNTKNIGGV